MSLYLYAVLGARPATPLGEGLAGETLRTIDCGALVAAVGMMSEAPAISNTALRGHDDVVRRLARSVDAVLPARFGALAADDRVLCERLESSARDLGEALARVAGREQMILRVWAGTTDEADTPAADASRPVAAAPPAVVPPGTRYLMERAHAQRVAAEIHELAPLRPMLARFVVAERVERHHTPPLLASAYHLIARGASADYTTAVESAAAALTGLRVSVSGPWAPYAFAPEALG